MAALASSYGVGFYMNSVVLMFIIKDLFLICQNYTKNEKHRETLHLLVHSPIGYDGQS